MATAAPSPLASNAEKTNGAKLSRLLIDGGTTVLRNAFDYYHPPANLAADLNVQFKTLHSLLRRRVLNKSQWDKLFPPSGATPDSKTFDITLLFLLLTNICGLSPPPSGWHNKPLPSDTSLEANLARIKFFRNELYGHVSSTGVDTPTFTPLWQEISAVLVSLGLDQAEIDRLDAEHCGEEDYLDVLLDWAGSEEDINSQLKDIRQCQTETQKDVGKIHQIQLEDRKTLEDSISKLEEVHQIETKIHQAINEAHHTQIEDHKTLQDTVLKLDEMNHIENKTHQAIKEARQTQLEDHKTLQDSISILEESQTKTGQTLEKGQETLQAGLQNVKLQVENLKKQREKDRADEVLRNLAKTEFKGDVECHAEKFQEGTREWIFKKVDDWLDDRSSTNRVMVISGNAGMGKSVISAVICKRMQEAGRLSGSHFCQHNNTRYRKPQLMLQSLACHLSQALPEYKNALVEQLSRNLGMELNSMGVEELFALLFKEPLSTATDPGRNILMVIDGLDESEYQGRNELLDVIANHFCKLPQWIRFFVTTRSEINIADSLKHLQPIQLKEHQEENLRDIQLFFEMQLNHAIEEPHKDDLLKKLVEKSEGVFLYAYFLIDFIEKNVSLLTLAQLENSLPLGISSVYLTHFKRLENELCKELKIEEEQVLRFLCALCASREPLPVAFISKILIPSGRSLTAQRRVNKVISCISTLLPVRDGCLHFFHKSVKDWLTNTSYYGQHDFTVNEKEGHEILFNLCTTELDSIKRKGVHDTQFGDIEKYALQHGVQHMIEVEEFDESSRPYKVDELVNKYVMDVKLIYAKLRVNSTATSEDILSVRKHIKAALLSEQSHSILTSLLKVLRKHSYLLRDHPHLLFQSLLNEGCTQLSCRAATILENELPNIPYMKYADREEQTGSVQARFYCSDTVACFDVSPEMDYMVCECRDGTIHLWSLQTGNREWSRPSLMERTFDAVSREGNTRIDGGAYCGINCKVLTFYRSVVFHPSGKSVLPGSLKSVYTLSGDYTDLFSNSECTFSHCAFPSDRRVILTDCFDDPKKIVLWSMENGDALKRIQWDDVISSFAISQDGSLVAVADLTGSICLIDVDKWHGRRLLKVSNASCGLMHFTPDNEILVCGYLRFMMEELGSSQYGWVFDSKPTFVPCFFQEDPQFFPSSSHPRLLRQIDFVLWPIEPRALTRKQFFDEAFFSSWVKNVRRVFPMLRAGFYKMLNEETALIGSPSFNFVALVNVNLLNEVNSASTREVVKEVVFSFEGDAIYSISSDQERACEVLVTVFRISSQEILVKKTFTCPSLILVPMKEGVVLCMKHKVPELWNFQLSVCIQTLPNVKDAEKLTRMSHELIACPPSSCPRLTPEELSNFVYPSEEDDYLELDDSIELDDFDDSLDLEDSSVVDDSSDVDISLDFSRILFPPFRYIEGVTVTMTMLPTTFRTLVVDILNVSSGECVSSVKTRVYVHDNTPLVVLCNSQNQLLVCTSEEIDDNFFDIEKLTFSLRNNNFHEHVWERSAVRYNAPSFAPHFLFSPKEEFVVTWSSLDSGYGLHIIDAKTGETRYAMLKDRDDIVDCKFIVDGESLVCCSQDNFLRLFNVKSGDLLSVLDIGEQPISLGACLGSSLVAIGLSGARLKFIHVELPRVKDAEEKKGSMTKWK